MAQQRSFSFCDKAVTAVAASVGFVMALALNHAFVTTLDTLAVDKQHVAGAWAYAGAVLAVGLAVLYGMSRVRCVA